MAKNILATRLRALVTHGVLEIVPAADGSAYQEYVLTEKGRALFPVIVGLRQWGRSSVCRGRSALNAGGKRQRPPRPAPDADRQRRADAHPAEYPGGEARGTVMRVSGGARSSPAEKPADKEPFQTSGQQINRAKTSAPNHSVSLKWKTH